MELYKKGERVEYIAGRQDASPSMVGKTGTVAVDQGTVMNFVEVDFDDRDTGRYCPFAENLRRITGTEPDARDKLIEDQRAELLTLQRRLNDTRTKWAEEIERLGEAMIEAADEKDLCSDYDDFVDGVNNWLTNELPIRQHSYRVRVEFVQYINVEARNEDAAINKARDEYDYGRCDSNDESTIDAELDDE